MTAELILAIDQGSTNSKAVLVDRDGAVVAESSVRVPVAFPRPGWVESDGRDLWTTVQEAVTICLAAAAATSIRAVAVANQRESVLLWDRRSGSPLGPCVSWQCRRSVDICDDLRRRGLGELVQQRTGLALDPMFSAGKARWLLDRVDDGEARARRGEICVGTVDAWLAWNLSGGSVFATDLTNASRTQLLDVARLRWDEELTDAFGIPAAALPELHGSSAIVGTTAQGGAVPAGLPIAALMGDSHAALFGHGAPGPGAVKATYGTGTSVMAPTGDLRRSRDLSSTVAWSMGPSDEPGDEPARPEVMYALEGNIIATGAALEWLASILATAGGEAELEHLAGEVDDAAGVYVVPAFAGLGAPHWDAEARGTISGISRGTTRAHLARATFESIAYQVRDVMDALREALPVPPTAIYADGGALRSDLLAQVQADVVGLPVLRNRSASLAALGAAYLAGMATGLWESVDAIRALPRDLDRFDPHPDASSATSGYDGWRVALRRTAGSLASAPLTTGSEA